MGADMTAPKPSPADREIQLQPPPAPAALESELTPKELEFIADTPRLPPAPPSPATGYIPTRNPSSSR